MRKISKRESEKTTISYVHKIKAAITNIKWLKSDSVNGTTAVFGSVSQYHAPHDAIIDINANKTEM